MYLKRWGERNISGRVRLTLFPPPTRIRHSSGDCHPLIPATNLVSLLSDLPRSYTNINDAHRIRWNYFNNKNNNSKREKNSGKRVSCNNSEERLHTSTDGPSHNHKRKFSFLCFVYNCTNRNRNDWTRGTNINVCRIRQLQEPACISVTDRCRQMSGNPES